MCLEINYLFLVHVLPICVGNLIVGFSWVKFYHIETTIIVINRLLMLAETDNHVFLKELGLFIHNT